jgi:hypothetical protein
MVLPKTRTNNSEEKTAALHNAKRSRMQPMQLLRNLCSHFRLMVSTRTHLDSIVHNALVLPHLPSALPLPAAPFEGEKQHLDINSDPLTDKPVSPLHCATLTFVVVPLARSECVSS